MSGVVERAAEFFLAPAVAPAADTSRLPPAVRVVVLGSESDVVPLAAAVALSLRAGAAPVAVGARPPAAAASFRPGARVPAAVVAYWPGEAVKPSAATRAAALVARRLTAHDMPALARGRLAWLALPEEPAAAATAVRSASALVDGSLVTALAGARPPELECLVEEHDLVIVATVPETTLARAAVARLTDRGVPASAWPPLRRGVTRTLALAGLAAPRIAVGGSPAQPPAR